MLSNICTGSPKVTNVQIKHCFLENKNDFVIADDHFANIILISIVIGLQSNKETADTMHQGTLKKAASEKQTTMAKITLKEAKAS